jgi:hypothetical protein
VCETGGELCEPASAFGLQELLLQLSQLFSQHPDIVDKNSKFVMARLVGESSGAWTG